MAKEIQSPIRLSDKTSRLPCLIARRCGAARTSILDALKAEMAGWPRRRRRAKELASRNDLNGGRLKVGRLRGGVGQAGRRVFVPSKHDSFGLLDNLTKRSFG